MPDQAPRRTLGELTRQALAAAAARERNRLVEQLARVTRTPEQITAVADLLLAADSPGRRVFLEWVGRLRGQIPAPVLAKIPPLVADRKLPVVPRVAGAARFLRSSPDRPAVVLPVARALTAGLSGLKSLDRLRRLQHELPFGRSLDALIERRERRVKVDCPRCRIRLPRAEMVKHLWHAHGLVLDGEKVHGLERVTDPAELRARTAASDPPAEDVAPLRAAAEVHGSGLCPGCFAELPVPVEPLPQPLTLSHGRLSGEGYVAEVGGTDWLRTVTISTPGNAARTGSAHQHVLGPRGAATVVAAVVLLVGFVAAVAFRASPAAVGWLIGLAAVSYLGVRFTLHRPLSPADRAIDAAWSVIVPGLIGNPDYLRYLARLCRTSLGRGDPDERAVLLTRLVQGTTDLRLLAVVEVLRVDDAGLHGRDAVAGLVGLCEAAFRGDRPAEFAEYVAAAALGRDPPPDPSFAARLRVLLSGAAFGAGLRPRDLLDLWAVAPHMRRAMAVDPPHRLGLLYGVWLLWTSPRWEQIGPAVAVFELCRHSPHVSGRLLTQFPDLLLAHRPDPDTEAELGPVLVCGRGVAVGGQLAADPDAVVHAMKGGLFGGWVLRFGPHHIRVTRRPPEEFLETVRRLLRLRSRVLLPMIEGYLNPGPPEVGERLLGPFSTTCPRCGTISAVTAGRVGITRPD
jgi:hypothetical protein